LVCENSTILERRKSYENEIFLISPVVIKFLKNSKKINAWKGDEKIQNFGEIFEKIITISKKKVLKIRIKN